MFLRLLWVSFLLITVGFFTVNAESQTMTLEKKFSIFETIFPKQETRKQITESFSQCIARHKCRVSKDGYHLVKDVAPQRFGAAETLMLKVERCPCEIPHKSRGFFEQLGLNFKTALDRATDSLEDLFKDVCEGLKIEDGKCGICWTSEGGEDGSGEFYACEGGDPDKGIPPSSITPRVEPNTPSKEELESFEKWVEATEPRYDELEPWGDGLSRFLPPDVILGTPLPEGMVLKDITETGKIREEDGYGVGYFLSPRADKKQNGKGVTYRYHGGVDFVTSPGEKIFSPVSGTIIRISDAYRENSQGLKAVVIRSADYYFKVLYVNPTVLEEMPVQAGGQLGTAQDLSVKFKQKGNKKMTNHTHLTILDADGNRISPNNKWVIKPKKP